VTPLVDHPRPAGPSVEPRALLLPAASAGVSALVLVAGARLGSSTPRLPWVVPAVDLLVIAALLGVALLAGIDATLRSDTRALPLAAVSVTVAVLWIPHFATFPGILPPGLLAGVTAQSAAVAFHAVHLGTPIGLAWVLFQRPRRLVDAGRAVARMLGLAVAVGVVAAALAEPLVAPHLPPLVQGGAFTRFNQVLQGAAVVPALALVVAFGRGRRADVRTAVATQAALASLLVEALAESAISRRYSGVWYADLVLRLLPPLILLGGQLSLYVATVRAELAQLRDAALLDEVARELNSILDPQRVLERVARAAAEIASPPGQPLRRAQVFRVDGGIATVHAEYDESGMSLDQVSWPIDIHPVMEAVVRTGVARSCLLDADSLAEPLGGLVRESGVTAGAYARISVRGSVFGLLAVAKRSGGPVTDQQVSRLTALSTLAGMALTNALAHDEVAASERRYRLLADHSTDVIRLVDRAGTVEYVSPSCRTVLGHDPEAVVGRPIWQYVHPEDVAVLEDAGARLGTLGGAETLVYRCRRADGGYIWAESAVRAVTDDGSGVPTGLLYASRDITARKHAEEQLEASRSRLAELAATDPVTGLGNRRRFEKALAELPRQAFAIVAIDVDGLKAVNDQLGHGAGDVLLTTVATTVDAVLRRGDVLARVGGDEFAVLLHGATVTQAAEAGERMRTAMHGAADNARISVGCVGAPEGADPHAVWRAADTALYQAKRRGRDQVVALTAEDVESTLLPSLWNEALGSVLDGQGSITAVFQPIVRLSDGATIAHEGLVRPQGHGPMDSVEGLFDAAHRLGRARDLDWLCRRVVLESGGGLGLPLFVNVSTHALLDPVHDPDQMMLLLDLVGRRPEEIVLELTERERIADLGRLQSVLAHYRRHGFRFALDDVGDGHATLEVMAAARPEFIKIARSLTTTVGQAGSRTAIMGIVAFARLSNAVVIAEGIETAEVGSAVGALGVQAGQGYAYGRPCAVEETEVITAAAL
jgi:diguanylate cyclase (GGDEF)-like protein/PAS domain S-box-containing protein